MSAYHLPTRMYCDYDIGTGTCTPTDFIQHLILQLSKPIVSRLGREDELLMEIFTSGVEPLLLVV